VVNHASTIRLYHEQQRGGFIHPFVVLIFPYGMKMIYSILKSRHGFTLIELMIVVVILGILVTLATGGFLSYQAKAKQAEAKTNLGAIGELVISYKVEYDTYITNWSGIGWQVQGKTRYSFWYNGQAAAGTPTVAEVGVNYSDPGSAAANSTFTVAAVGNIDRDNSTDQWLYNQTRSFTILQNDVVTP